MEAVEIDIANADRTALLAECERLLVPDVTPGLRVPTLRKKLRQYQRDRLTYQEWENLIWRLIGTRGMDSRPRPLTAEGMVEWACDIMFRLLDLENYVGSTNDTKRFRDRATGNTVQILSRQGAMNVNIVIVNTGGSGSMAILHAATCVFESVRLLVGNWNKWKREGTKGTP